MTSGRNKNSILNDRFLVQNITPTSFDQSVNKKIVIQMKGSFLIVFLLVEFIAFVNGSALKAQDGHRQMSVIKNNFTSFTRKYTNRGKTWMVRNKAYLHHPDANF